MIESYQEEQALLQPEPEDAAFASVGTVFEDGVSLIFDGDITKTESVKHYKVNSFVVFKAGDRVRIIKDSGSYVVEYPIGNPRTSFVADTATNADEATKAKNFSGQHTGNTIAFFNNTPKSRAKNIYTLKSNATLAQVIGEWNTLIEAIDGRGYGLID